METYTLQTINRKTPKALIYKKKDVTQPLDSTLALEFYDDSGFFFYCILCMFMCVCMLGPVVGAGFFIRKR